MSAPQLVLECPRASNLEIPKFVLTEKGLEKKVAYLQLDCKTYTHSNHININPTNPSIILQRTHSSHSPQLQR